MFFFKLLEILLCLQSFPFEDSTANIDFVMNSCFLAQLGVVSDFDII